MANYFKTALFVLVAPGTAVALIPYFLISWWGRTFQARNVGGLILLLLGLAGELWCAFNFAHYGKGTPSPADPPKKFVARGLYKFTRNPMYVSLCTIVLGEALYFGRVVLLIYPVFLWLAFHLFVVLYEEPTLRKKFSIEYENYCRHVPRWFPSFFRCD